MEQEYRDLVYLVSCAVNETVPEKTRIDEMNQDVLEHLATFHKMDALVAYALVSAGIESKFCTQAIDGEVRKEILWDLERQSVYNALNGAKIWYMPLKGSVLKACYPKIGMRQMSDTDILFDANRAEEVKGLMEALGYTCVHFGVGNQDDYQKEPFFHFEMHWMLFDPLNHEGLYRYYAGIEKKLLSGEGYERHFSPEDFYLYMIVHCYKHFYSYGVGLRTLLDIYVYLKSCGENLNWDYIAGELAVLGVEDFEQKARQLALKVFPQGITENLSREEEQLLGIFAESGMYGTRKRSVQLKVQDIGKMRFLLERIFLPMPKVARFYPFFYRHKILLPILPFYRLLRGKKNAAKEWKALSGK